MQCLFYFISFSTLEDVLGRSHMHRHLCLLRKLAEDTDVATWGHRAKMLRQAQGPPVTPILEVKTGSLLVRVPGVHSLLYHLELHNILLFSISSWCKGVLIT